MCVLIAPNNASNPLKIMVLALPVLLNSNTSHLKSSASSGELNPASDSTGVIVPVMSFRFVPIENVALPLARNRFTLRSDRYVVVLVILILHAEAERVTGLTAHSRSLSSQSGYLRLRLLRLATLVLFGRLLDCKSDSLLQCNLLHFSWKAPVAFCIFLVARDFLENAVCQPGSTFVEACWFFPWWANTPFKVILPAKCFPGCSFQVTSKMLIALCVDTFSKFFCVSCHRQHLGCTLYHSLHYLVQADSASASASLSLHPCYKCLYDRILSAPCPVVVGMFDDALFGFCWFAQCSDLFCRIAYLLSRMLLGMQQRMYSH